MGRWDTLYNCLNVVQGASSAQLQHFVSCNILLSISTSWLDDSAAQNSWPYKYSAGLSSYLVRLETQPEGVGAEKDDDDEDQDDHRLLVALYVGIHLFQLYSQSQLSILYSRICVKWTL